MADRYTRKDAEGAFRLLAKTAGKRVAESYNDVGAWFLDWNGTYGGAKIMEVTGPTGGQRSVAIERRLPAKDFYYACHFAIRVIEEMGRETAS